MLDRRLKERLVGAIVLVLLAVIFVPMLLEDEDASSPGITETNIPPRPDIEFKSKLIPVEETSKQTQPDLKVVPQPPAREVVDITPAAKQEVIVPPAVTVKPAPETVKQKPVAPITTAKTPPATVPAAVTSRTSTLPKVEKGLTAWVIQVGSFANRDNAEKLNKKLRDKEYRAFVQAVKNNAGVTIYKVRVGPEILRSSANKLKDKLAKSQSLKGIIMAYP